jgi:hypothetical protein
VRIQTSDQAMALGTAVADIARALGMVDERAIQEVQAEAAQELARVNTPADILQR